MDSTRATEGRANSLVFPTLQPDIIRKYLRDTHDLPGGGFEVECPVCKSGTARFWQAMGGLEVSCAAGCDPSAILRAAGLAVGGGPKPSKRAPEVPEKKAEKKAKPQPEKVAETKKDNLSRRRDNSEKKTRRREVSGEKTHTYFDDQGHHVATVKAATRQGRVVSAWASREDGNGGSEPASFDSIEFPYRHLGLDPTRRVFLLPTENLVDSLYLRDGGHTPATTFPGGDRNGGEINDRALTHVAGFAEVVILTDGVEPERAAFFQRVKAALAAAGASLRIMRPDEPGADLEDWLLSLPYGLLDELADRMKLITPAAQSGILPPAPDRPWAVPEGHIEPLPFLDLSGPIKPPDWLIPGYIARKEIGYLCGYSESGKTTLAVALLHAIAKGQPFLGIESAYRGPVLYLDEEMGEDEMIRYCQRLGGAHADLHVTSLEGLSITDGRAMTRIEHAINKVRPIFVGMDSLREFLGTADENDSGAAADVTSRIRWLIKRYEFTCLLNAHLVKPPRDPAKSHIWDKNLLRGSGHFAAGVPYVLAVRRDPVTDNVGELHQWKRRGAKLPPLLYRFDGGNLETDPIQLTALGYGERDSSGDSAARRAATFVLEFIAENGPQTRATLRDVGKKRNLGERTIDRAIVHIIAAAELHQEAGKGGRFYVSGQQELL